MPDKSTSFIKLMSKKLAAMILMIILLLLFLMLTIFFMNQGSRNEYTVIDVFGRQRMLTQQLSKDANQKYAIMQALNNQNSVGTDEIKTRKIESLNISMEKAKNEYLNTLQFLKSGYLKKGDTSIDFKSSLRELNSLIEVTDDLWKDFLKAIDVIIRTSEIDEEVSKSLTYINDNNEQLLQYSDDILQSLINIHKSNSNTSIFIALGLFAATLVSLLVLILQSYKYIVVPLNEVYSGFSNIGSLKNNISISLPQKNELEPVIKEIDMAFAKLNRLIELIKNMNQDTSFDGILKYIYNTFSEFIPYSHIGIALLKDDGETIEASYGISDPSLNDLAKKLHGITAKLDETSLSDVIRKGKPRVINDLESYTKHRDADYNRILIETGIKSSITLPLSLNNKPIGIIFFSSTTKNIYKEQHIDFLATLSSSIAISLNKNIFIDELLYSTVLALAKLAESRDEDTGEHLERMKKYSVKITEFLLEDNVYDDKITVGFMKEIERFSPMHDIGKVGIRDEILLKPGKLTQEEFDEMKKHTIFGAEVLKTAEEHMRRKDANLFRMGIEIAENHHEKWDGTGYPYGKAGESIPLSARIVAVADVFDALTSIRPYKKAFSFEESLNMIIEGKGKHFDPRIVDSFVRHKEQIFEVYKSFNTDESSLNKID